MIIEGIVVHGNSLGGRMGFPTANIEADAALDARDGVYASRVEVDGRMYDAMSNLGYKPTVDGRRRLLETNIFGFEGDLYGRRLRVELLRFIRPERRFGSVEELFRRVRERRSGTTAARSAAEEENRLIRNEVWTPVPLNLSSPDTPMSGCGSCRAVRIRARS